MPPVTPPSTPAPAPAPAAPAPKAKRKKKTGLIIALAIIAVIAIAGGIGGGFSSRNKSSNIAVETPGPDVPPLVVDPSIPKSEKTIMIYMLGSNLEGEYGAMSTQIRQILNSGIDPQRNKVLIYTGGATRWWTEQIPADQNCIFLVDGRELKLLESYPSKSMTDGDTLAEFLSYGFQHYPSEEYGLVLCDHGGGPNVGFGVDELHDRSDRLSLGELTRTLRSIGLGQGTKFEYVIFNACLMGSLETGWALKDYANYLIASEEVTYTFAWDFSFMRDLDRIHGGQEMGVAVTDAFIQGYETLYRNQHSSLPVAQCYSCLDLSQATAMESALGDLFEAVDNDLRAGYFNTVSLYRYSARTFGMADTTFDSKNPGYDLIDLGHMVSMLQGDYSAQCSALLSTMDRFVCYARSASNGSALFPAEHTCGVSVYHPYYTSANTLDAYNALGFSPQYTQYVNDFYNIRSSVTSDAWGSMSSIGSTITPAAGGKGNTISIQLTPEQARDFAGATYYVLLKNRPEWYSNGIGTYRENKYAYVWNGIDAKLDENGTLSASYDNRSVYFVDDTTGEVSPIPVALKQSKDNSGEIVYYIDAVALAIDSFPDDYDPDSEDSLDILLEVIESMHSEGVRWYFQEDEDGNLTPGAFLADPDEDTPFPQMVPLDYRDFADINIIHAVREVVRDDKGNMLPFRDWQFDGEMITQNITVKNGFHFETRNIEDKTDYYYMFVIDDVYGNQYATELFPLAG